MKETARLEDFFTKYPAARQALGQDSYVDNTNTGADNHEELLKKIAEIEYVSSKGGFYYKPWIVSGSESEDMLLGPRSDDENIEKNLGVLWLVKKDHFKSSLTLVLVEIRERVSKYHFYQL